MKYRCPNCDFIHNDNEEKEPNYVPDEREYINVDKTGATCWMCGYSSEFVDESWIADACVICDATTEYVELDTVNNKNYCRKHAEEIFDVNITQLTLKQEFRCPFCNKEHNVEVGSLHMAGQKCDCNAYFMYTLGYSPGQSLKVYRNKKERRKITQNNFCAKCDSSRLNYDKTDLIPDGISMLYKCVDCGHQGAAIYSIKFERMI